MVALILRSGLEAQMISITGKNAYGVLRDLCCLENPKVKTFEQLWDLLLQHSKPKRLEVTGLYRFHFPRGHRKCVLV